MKNFTAIASFKITLEKDFKAEDWEDALKKAQSFKCGDYLPKNMLVVDYDDLKLVYIADND